MQSLSTTTIEQILGKSEKRYFSNGFRYFNIDLENLEIFSKEIYGQIAVKYNGPKRPHGEPIHIGSIELMAFSLRISTSVLNRLCKINITDTNRAFLKTFSIQIYNCMPIATYNFIAKILSTSSDKNSLQGYISHLEIQFENHAKIKVTVDHRGYSTHKSLEKDELISLEYEQLHSIGYKSTQINFAPLEINLDSKTITTTVLYKHLLLENTFDGIGSARNNLLPTDALRIYGQLMQSLLYKLTNSDRKNSQNIWLRKMHLFQERPLFKETINASITFEDTREITLSGIKWNLIKLNGTVGNYIGTFQLAQKQNKYE
ncbi:AvrD family protein [Sphingobacterium bovistauri]|uniref:Avirulence D protein (AvrD) n=1 Tax=Sphingobacterium bovistauri TaxID=2781959 RepID=A0ABS7Z3B3_9SPHI|nr:AvrD family protein [Sphingobacterium bovistauri]MCA5004062.1 hypothetical protein [Sphingobacterium bovistauri]